MQGCRFNTPNLSASNVQGLKRPSGGSSRFTAPDRHSTVLHVPGRMQSQVQGLLRLIELQSKGSRFTAPDRIEPRVQGLQRSI